MMGRNHTDSGQRFAHRPLKRTFERQLARPQQWAMCVRTFEKFRQAPRIPVHVCDVASSGEVLQPTSTQSYQSDAMMLIGGLVAVAMALSTSSTTSSHISHSASHVHSPASPIDRESVVRRHVVVLSGVGSDPRADTAHITYGALTMTVGNGAIGFNADATGMQSLNLTCVFSTPCTCDLSPISVCIFESLCSIDRVRSCRALLLL